MMTEQLGFSILAAPIAAVDRRALSQAWYSALHLAHGSSPRAAAAPSAEQRVLERTPIAKAYQSFVNANAKAHALDARVPLRERRMAAAEPGALERRASRSALARAIERTFLDPRAQVRRATFAVGDGADRVHVTLQTIGKRVRLVAVCAPNARPAVSKALAQARFALAERGIEVSLC